MSHEEEGSSSFGLWLMAYGLWLMAFFPHGAALAALCVRNSRITRRVISSIGVY